MTANLRNLTRAIREDNPELQLEARRDEIVQSLQDNGEFEFEDERGNRIRITADKSPRD